MPAWDVVIDDKPYHVEIPSPGARPLQVIVDGQSFEVCIGSAPGAVATAVAKPSAVPVPAVPKNGSSMAPIAQAGPSPVRPAPQVQPCGASAVTAPMPGTILSVEVSCGQQVEAGALLCYLEAMKMKNAIRSPLGGTVVEVAIQAGQTVSYGQALFRVE